MGTEYSIYTEINVNGKWVCANGLYPKINKDGSITRKLSDTYWNGSRSYFHEAYEKMREIGYSIPFSEVSDELKAALPGYLEPEEDFFSREKRCKHVIVVDFAEFSRLATNNGFHDTCGFVLKSDIFKHEKEGEEIWNWLSAEDYKELDDEEKKLYQAYEWDDASGWFAYFKTINEAVRHQLSSWDNINFNYPDDGQVRIICIAG